MNIRLQTDRRALEQAWFRMFAEWLQTQSPATWPSFSPAGDQFQRGGGGAAAIDGGPTVPWRRTQTVAADRIQRSGDATRFEVRHGDRVANTNGTRAERVGPEIEPGTTERYQWKTMFGRGFPKDDRWQVFTQWHQTSGGGSPPVEFHVRRGEMYLTINRPGQTNYKTFHLGPANEETWQNFDMQVKWSSDPNVGHIRLMVNGVVKVDEHLPTMFPGERNYMKQGLYRHPDIRGTGVIYHSDVRIDGGSTPLSELPEARNRRRIRA
jgi:hypothetical protein